MFIDSHAHIDGSEFDADREEVIRRARDAGVSTILNVGTGDPHSGALERAVELAETHEGVYTAVGTHPHDARLFDDKAEERISSLVKGSRVVAWGEIGLDFHYDNSPRDVQMKVFRRQLVLAREALLPVIVHTRDAEVETIDILRAEWAGAGLPGIMHCFSGSRELALKTIELGFSISFSGIVTFKKADDLRAVARAVSADRLLIETDCPYLAPVPYRGKRNEPAFVVEVARSLAELHEISLEEMGRITSANFRRMFGLEVQAGQIPTDGVESVRQR
ncbi:MAG: TatD family hydrolase [Pyrinomonadaceae bacterium]